MNPVKQRSRFDWQLRTHSVHLGECTRIMAIVDLAPETVFGSHHLITQNAAAYVKLAVAAAVEAADGGADIINLGFDTNGPQTGPSSSIEEQMHLIPVLQGLKLARPEAIIAVDIVYPDTARPAARAGAEILQDVSALSGASWNEEMMDAIAHTGCAIVLIHTRARPRQWLAQGSMSNADIAQEVFGGLCERLAMAEAAGIATWRTTVDPGFGIGKCGAENFTLLAGLSRLHELGRPLLVGLSDRRFLGDAVKNLQPKDLTKHQARRTATIAANVAAILSGAHILKVRDLQAAREAAAVADAVLAASAKQNPHTEH